MSTSVVGAVILPILALIAEEVPQSHLSFISCCFQQVGGQRKDIGTTVIGSGAIAQSSSIILHGGRMFPQITVKIFIVM